MTFAHLAIGGHLSTVMLAAAAKKSSSGSATLLLFVLLFAAMYFLWLRPQRKKMQARQQAQVRSIDVGDEVVTQSGIIGTVVGLDDDRAEIQVADGVVVSVVRAAIGRRVEPVVETEPSDLTTDDGALATRMVAPRGRFWQRRVRGEDA